MARNTKLKVDIKADNLLPLQIENTELKRKNEELAAENSRLLVELEGITSDKQYAENAYNNAKGQIDYLKRTKNELREDRNHWYDLYMQKVEENASIKSTRLYKFFKWLGVW